MEAERYRGNREVSILSCRRGNSLADCWQQSRRDGVQTGPAWMLTLAKIQRTPSMEASPDQSHGSAPADGTGGGWSYQEAGNALPTRSGPIRVLGLWVLRF